jgi:hypothetical protein
MAIKNHVMFIAEKKYKLKIFFFIFVQVEVKLSSLQAARGRRLHPVPQDQLLHRLSRHLRPGKNLLSSR